MTNNPSPTKRIEQWRREPLIFIEDALVDPETGRAFVLYKAEQEFIRRAFTVTDDGRLPFPEMVFSAPKKSGKTALAAMLAIYSAIVLAPKFGEVYCLANDMEQARSRVFEAAVRIVEASPVLRGAAKITANRIEFLSSGSFIAACASDYTGFAGANPTLTICDELWGFTSESSRRLFDEGVPSPARKVSGRLTVTYAGFEGESDLLESMYKRAMTGRRVAPDLRVTSDGMLCYWSHTLRAPWQTKQWREQMRVALRANQFLRMLENRWVTSESSFIEMDQWDKCIDPALSPMLADPHLAAWAGVDASVKRDSTAIAVCGYDAAAKKVRLVWHRIFQPTAKNPLNFEETIERTLLELRRRFYVRQVLYDPYQMAASSQRLLAAGVPMVEFPQTVGNLTDASSNLYDLIKDRNLIAYADDDLRLAISRAVAIETPRGWKISKATASHKIDVVVALAQAALAAVRGQAGEVPLSITLAPLTSHFAPRGARAGFAAVQRPVDSCCKAQDDEDDRQGDPVRWYNGDARDLFAAGSAPVTGSNRWGRGRGW